MAYGWVEIAEADAYFATRLGAAEYWATGTEKEAALQTAYNDLIYCGLFSFPSTATDKMKYGQCEQALFLLRSDPDKRADLQAQGVKKAWIIKEEFRSDAEGVMIAPKVKVMLEEYETLANSGGAAIAYIERDEDA